MAQQLSDLPWESVSHDIKLSKRVMIKRGQVPNLMNFSQAIIPTGESTTPHRHPDMVEIYFVQAGLGTLLIDGNKHVLEHNTYQIVPAKSIHSLSNTGESPLAFLYFGISSQKA